MTKYALIYKNDNNETIFCGSFIAKNHHRIKFVMYRYLKSILGPKKRIRFAIRQIKTGITRIYIGTTKEMKETIGGVKIKAINKVFEPSCEDDARIIWNKIKPKGTIPYTKTHDYREEYDSDELSMSETDSELEEDV